MSYHYPPTGRLTPQPPSPTAYFYIIGTMLVLAALALHEFFAGMP